MSLLGAPGRILIVSWKLFVKIILWRLRVNKVHRVASDDRVETPETNANLWACFYAPPPPVTGAWDLGIGHRVIQGRKKKTQPNTVQTLFPVTGIRCCVGGCRPVCLGDAGAKVFIRKLHLAHPHLHRPTPVFEMSDPWIMEKCNSFFLETIQRT